MGDRDGSAARTMPPSAARDLTLGQRDTHASGASTSENQIKPPQQLPATHADQQTLLTAAQCHIADHYFTVQQGHYYRRFSLL